MLILVTLLFIIIKKAAPYENEKNENDGGGRTRADGRQEKHVPPINASESVRMSARPEMPLWSPISL